MNVSKGGGKTDAIRLCFVLRGERRGEMTDDDTCPYGKGGEEEKEGGLEGQEKGMKVLLHLCSLLFSLQVEKSQGEIYRLRAKLESTQVQTTKITITTLPLN